MCMAVLETPLRANKVRTRLRQKRGALDSLARFVQELRNFLARTCGKELEHVLHLSEELQRSCDAFYPVAGRLQQT
jgi:hypothetical protein